MTTIRARVWGHYGLQRPFNFKVAIPFLLSAFGLAFVLIISAIPLTDEVLKIGTERFYFFLYVSVLFLVAAALARATSLSLAVFLWGTTELGLALSTSVLQMHGIGISLLPPNLFTEDNDHGFVYHSFLQYAPKPNFQRTWRPDPRNKEAYERLGWPMNWEELNRDFSFTHNSLGLRGIEPPNNDLRPMIFAYGGSTTYDVSVSQGETWVERLQDELKNRYILFNFGVPGQSTTEHLISSVFYQKFRGRRPVCALYYVGANDIHTAHMTNLDPAYADWHGLVVARRRPDLWAAKYSPLMRFLSKTARRRFDSIPETPSLRGMSPITGSDRRLEEIFAEHISTIASINAARGVKTVFIGQMQNLGYFKYWPQQANALAALVRNEDVWCLQERFNSILKDTAGLHHAGYIDPGIENFVTSDFTDQWHFSATGSKKFAALISQEVDSNCK